MHHTNVAAAATVTSATAAVMLHIYGTWNGCASKFVASFINSHVEGLRWLR